MRHFDTDRRIARHPERGMVLVAGIVVVLVLSGLAMALMTTNVNESNQKKFSSERARALYIAEAGIKFSIVNLEAGGTGVIGTQSSPASFGGGGYYTKATFLGAGSWSLLSVGTRGGERRVIEAVVVPERKALFGKALFGDLDLGANGTVFTDSYNTNDGSYLSQRTHSVTIGGKDYYYANPNGSVGSNQTIELRGDVVILGDARPGPGYSVQESGTGIYVQGSTAPMTKAEPVQPYVYTPPPISYGAFSTGGASSLTLGSGVGTSMTYRYTNFSFSSDTVVHISGNVTLYVDSTFDMSGKGQIEIDPGSSLTIYHGGTDFTMTGQGVLNSNHDPKALEVFSTATNVSFTGTSGFYGAIYAPDAYVQPSGTTDIYGSLVGKQVYISGTANFHYDESLGAQKVLTGRLTVVSWRRMDSNLQ